MEDSAEPNTAGTDTRRTSYRVGEIGLQLSPLGQQTVEWTHRRSLADFDIVVARPSFEAFRKGSGTIPLDDLRHWTNEWSRFFRRRTTLVVLMAEFDEMPCTGLSRTISPCQLVDLPWHNQTRLHATQLKKTVLGEKLLSDFPRLVQAMDATIAFELGDSRPIITNDDGTAVLGAHLEVGDAQVCVLPNIIGALGPIRLANPSLEAKHEREVRTALRDFAIAAHSGTQAPAPPAWALGQSWATKAESEAAEQFSQVEGEIAKLERRRQELSNELLHSRSMRRLLYSKGEELERHVRGALNALGLDAQPFSHGHDNMDVRFEYAGTVYIGEVEGKDSKPIDINKYRQLSQMVLGEVARGGESIRVKGLLFGNPHRLLPPSERPELFTNYVRESAVKNDIILIPTTELYAAWRDLENGTVGAEAVRTSLLNHQGGIWTWKTA